MRPPINGMTLADIRWLANHRCKAHSMDFISHYGCYIREKPSDAPFHERIGFFDIETTGLKGNWDFILCYCLKEMDGKILGRHLLPSEITRYHFDKNLVKEMLADIRKFDRITTYYGSRFDIPFARTRAEKWGIEFPAYRDLWQTDCYDIAKHRLLLHSTRLEQVCKLMGIPTKGHRLEPDIWQKAQAGHKDSLAWIFTHCQEDVISLEAAWKRLTKYSMSYQKRSI